jgi:hypothetical protein
MWMGATSNKIMTAVLKTYVFVKIIPSFAAYFAMGLFAFVIIGALGTSAIWVITAIPVLLMIAIEITLIFIARGRMQIGFRGFINQPEGSLPIGTVRRADLLASPPPIPTK